MIALGSDHGGFALKEEIKAYLAKQGIEVRDFGSFSQMCIRDRARGLFF